jgi:hypothetical protein
MTHSISYFIILQTNSICTQQMELFFITLFSLNYILWFYINIFIKNRPSLLQIITCKSDNKIL